MSLGSMPQTHDDRKADIIRFSDIRLGQPVTLSHSEFEPHAMGERVCELVREWSGASRASIVSMHQPADGLAPDSLDGRVLARHLDGSNQADVEVLVRAQDVICLRAVVRVALG